MASLSAKIVTLSVKDQDLLRVALDRAILASQLEHDMSLTDISHDHDHVGAVDDNMVGRIKELKERLV